MNFWSTLPCSKESHLPMRFFTQLIISLLYLSGFQAGGIGYFYAFRCTLFSRIRKKTLEWVFEVPKPDLRIKRVGNASHSSDNHQTLQKRSFEQFAFLIRHLMELKQTCNEPKSKILETRMIRSKVRVLFRHIDSMWKKSMLLTDSASHRLQSGPLWNMAVLTRHLLKKSWSLSNENWARYWRNTETAIYSGRPFTNFFHWNSSIK